MPIPRVSTSARIRRKFTRRSRRPVIRNGRRGRPRGAPPFSYDRAVSAADRATGRNVRRGAFILHVRHNSFPNPNIGIRKDFLDRPVDNQTTECVASLQQDPGTGFRSPGRGTGAAVRRCVQGGSHLTGERPAGVRVRFPEPIGRRSFAIEVEGTVPVSARGRWRTGSRLRWPFALRVDNASSAYLAAG